MVRGKSIMFYIHYDEQGNIESVANHNNATLFIPTTKEIYDDFSFGKKHFHEYKIIDSSTNFYAEFFGLRVKHTQLLLQFSNLLSILINCRLNINI